MSILDKKIALVIFIFASIFILIVFIVSIVVGSRKYEENPMETISKELIVPTMEIRIVNGVADTTYYYQYQRKQSRKIKQ